jgi:alpha-D-ribose 1-methylphosphonate 5-triphosphate synthase subunit PhnH
MTVPTLSVRAAREQGAFRRLLEAMARPGRVERVDPHPEGGPFAAALGVLESLLDHEVTFAVVPDDQGARELLLRYTGSRAAPPERADFLLGHGEGVAGALGAAKPGELEYPDRSATVVALVAVVSERTGAGERLRLAGPGVPDTIDVWVDGFPAPLRALRDERNRGLPNGVDLVLVAPDGRFTCLPRYTRVEGAAGWAM